MKKFLSLLFSSLCALSLAACGTPKAPATMDVTIIEKNGTSLLVVVDGQGAGGALTVGTNHPLYDQNGKEITADALYPGLQLEIGFDGSILETFPGQVSGCKYLKITGEETDIADLQAELEEILPKAESDDPMPVLQVEFVGKQIASCLTASRGTSSWAEGDEAIIMDSPHPLNWPSEKMPSATVPDGCKEMRLILSKDPENLLVRRWELDDIGNSSAEEEILTLDEDGVLPLEPGVYEVAAEYTEGTMSWGFTVE